MHNVTLTSIQALRKHNKKLTKDENILYSLYLNHGSLTDSEASSMLGREDWPSSRVSARRNGLKAKNACKYVGKRVCSVTSEKVNEWRAITVEELREPKIITNQMEMIL